MLAMAVLVPPVLTRGTVGNAALEAVVISASRAEQRRFHAPGAIDGAAVDPFRTASPRVNLSGLMGSVLGLQIRDRQNFVQDRQVSVRGFGTRSTFGMRILIDGQG